MGSVRKPSAISDEAGRRMYASDIPYEEQMDRMTQKYLDGVKLIKQSEFKKPYQADSYEEMEHFADTGMPPWKFTPPTPDEGWTPDCKVQVEAAGAQDRGWGGCDPSDNCGLWIFTCAHRLKRIGCGNCTIKKIEKLDGDRLAVILCSDNDSLDISLVSDYDPKGSTTKERFCLGEGHNPNCSDCDSCTQAAYPPVISYTTQQMAINGTQNLSATGGGGQPYTWSITSGGGSLSKTVTLSGETTVYTAPATNAQCANNPTIQVKDYCNHTATLKIAINAVTGDTWAIWQNAFDGVHPGCPDHPNTVWRGKRWRCNGTYWIDVGICSACCPPHGTCVQCPTCDPACEAPLSPTGCCVYTANCADGQCVAKYKDVRTAAMKTNGCCPYQLL